MMYVQKLSKAQATQGADPLHRRLDAPHQRGHHHQSLNGAAVLRMPAVQHDPLPRPQGLRDLSELLLHQLPIWLPHAAERVHRDLGNNTMLMLCVLLLLLLLQSLRNEIAILS